MATVQDLINFANTVLLGETIDDQTHIRLFNEALQHLTPFLRLPATNTQTSVANQAAYALPSDLYEIEAVRYDGVRLDGLLTKGELAEANRLDNQPGTPTHYYLTPTSLVLVPAPAESGKTIEVHYNRRPAALAALTDVPELPLEYHELLAYYSAWQIRLRDQHPAAPSLRARFDEGLRDLARQFAMRQHAAYPITRDALPRPAGRRRRITSLDEWVVS